MIVIIPMSKSNSLLYILLITFGINSLLLGQKYSKIDSIIKSETTKPFNGNILISENGKIQYHKSFGYSNLEEKKLLQVKDQFVVGSISKQFTAVLVLREYDKGRLNLLTPIRYYLPELTQNWADTVNIHHLLTHMHGIVSYEQPTKFTPGTQYAYSQIGYDILAKIAEKTSGKSFANLSKELFDQCKMKQTFHPDIKAYQNLVNGYTENEKNALELEKATFENYPAAGSFVSTTSDLNRWNTLFYGGKLLQKGTINMLMTKQKGAVRNHPIFGITEYGYGITIDIKGDNMQLGQTGFAPGFVSMNFYFPKSKTSVIVLQNIVYDSDDLKITFKNHVKVLEFVKNTIH